MNNNNNNNRDSRQVNETQKNYDDRVRLGHLEREMGGIKGEVGLLKVAMTDNSAKLTGVQSQMDAIFRAIEKMADRIHEPKNVNWGWLISGVMGVLLLATSYTSVVTEPLMDRAEKNYETTQGLSEDLLRIDRRLSYQEGFAAGMASRDE